MSRFNVQCGEFVAVYGYDRPLTEYFMSIEGPTQAVEKLMEQHGLEYSFEPSEGRLGVHVVGTLSYPEVYGSAANWLEAAAKYGVKDCIPEQHLQTVAMDLPI